MPSLDTMTSYHRLKRAPLDDREVFNDLRELMDYCANGARYEGQRVVVLSNVIGSVEYVIKNNIPIIDMRGSEPIFKSIHFDGDNIETHGMLIYENNDGGIWDLSEVFSFNYSRLCLISQLEIFRILDAAGNRSFKFYIDRIDKSYGSELNTQTSWTQSYNPYDEPNEYNQNNISDTITEFAFKNSNDSWVSTNANNIYLMPKNSAANNVEKDYATKIYVKAEDYYNAYNSIMVYNRG